MDFSAAWVVLIGAHAAKPSHAGVRFHAFTMRASGWPGVAIIHRWSEAVRSHPRQSTGPNVGQWDALLPILVTDALAAPKGIAIAHLRPMASAGWRGARQAGEDPVVGGFGFLEKFADGRVAIAHRGPRDVAGWSGRSSGWSHEPGVTATKRGAA